jgi:hypothetical protein
MCGVWIDTYYAAIKPALAFPCLRVEKDLHPVTDLNGIGHLLFTASNKDEGNNADHHGDRSIDGPLRVTGHIAAGQHVNTLQKPDKACKKDQHRDYGNG